MRTASSSFGIIDTLAYARQVVAYAERIGFASGPNIVRTPMHHLGAILADSVLQAGINHKKIVRPRIDRIQQLFPEAAILSGIFASIDRVGLSDFLLWHHPAKPARFMALVELLRHQDIENVSQLQRWLLTEGCRHKLIAINGIGPKTVDYLCALVGHDCVAVDRHIRTFAKAAGVDVADYSSIQAVVSYAADLLGVSRRALDAWIWMYQSERQGRL